MAQYEKPHKPDKKLLKVIGLHIRNMRERKGLTIEQLSNKADINFKYLQRCETGKCNLSISILFSIARGLGIRPENFIKKIH